MATTATKVFSNDPFVKISANYRHLLKTNLAVYWEELPDFPAILQKLRAKGYFEGQEAVDYTAADFLKEFSLNEQMLKATPVELLCSPLTSLEVLTAECSLPSEFTELSPNIECYIEIINDVLQNRLAQKPYDNPSDQENVTEQEHALQAGKLGLLLFGCLEDVLGLLLHDIARPSINDPVHGHSKHCQEGSKILAPLGLKIDYAGHHAFAKYLLNLCCPSYKKLISDTSIFTLNIQEKGLAEEIKDLSSLDSTALARVFYQLMLMRIIDDSSKVSNIDLKRRLRGNHPEFFDSACIHSMLRRQIGLYLREKLGGNQPLEVIKTEIKSQLNEALFLLLRAKEASNAPQLYEKYESLLPACHTADPNQMKL
ncbi:hypothetical protein Lbir_1820 [Legionella birminghamensis]|uniref:Predicted HD phosphohydrolase n=1 Tax=Legionella birminghamensis TaxID=28083 RepID=A0A378I6I5_9GAMM|nr:hypothetical protein [Legionella birminghamensis]KTC70237.1 hypothetical protein Lbir_1820 [Legionella birminghamensis]STX30355.1 Predicted HD phosphohydrolase [Legionella birminghamensis]